MSGRIRREGWWLGVVVLLCAWWGMAVGPAEAGWRLGKRSKAAQPRYEAGTFFLDLQDHLDQSEVASFVKKYKKFGLKLRLNSPSAREEQMMEVKTTLRGAALDRLLKKLRQDKEFVEGAERSKYYRALGFPNDPQFKKQWNLKMLGAPRAWRWSRGGRVVVAVIDTGVTAHPYKQGRVSFRRVPDLAGTCFVPGYNFIHDRREAGDDHGHGTHVAGTIAQTTHNKLGVAGVAFRACIMPLKVLSAGGMGTNGDIADAIRFAADHGAQVINMSLGGWLPSVLIWKAIRHARRKGVVVIAAAGNSANANKHYPAAFKGVISISAVGPKKTLARYSTYGPWVTLAAPGGDFVPGNSADEVNGVLQNTIVLGNPAQSAYLYFQGTSMATPHAAGLAALLVAQGITDPARVLKIMKKTAVPFKSGGRAAGSGLIQAEAATFYAGFWLGLYRFLAALLLALGFFALQRQYRARGGTPSSVGGGLFWLGLIVGSSGFFFLPLWLGTFPGMTLLTQGFPAWDLALLGPGGHQNPLFYSALLPFGLVAVLGLRRFRWWVGFSLGIAAHLWFAALLRTADLHYIPNLLGSWLDRGWLLFHGMVAFVIALLASRQK